MGNSLGKNRDDLEDYKILCQKYNEEYKESNLYEDHYFWLKKLSKGWTTETFGEYKNRLETNCK